MASFPFLVTELYFLFFSALYSQYPLTSTSIPLPYFGVEAMSAPSQKSLKGLVVVKNRGLQDSKDSSKGESSKREPWLKLGKKDKETRGTAVDRDPRSAHTHKSKAEEKQREGELNKFVTIPLGMYLLQLLVLWFAKGGF